MKTPARLAVLMSLTGLGLGAGELAQASSHPTLPSNTVEALGLEHFDPADALDARAGEPSIPSGSLDVTLSLVDAEPLQSEEARAAIALAMVLMAEPFETPTVSATNESARAVPVAREPAPAGVDRDPDVGSAVDVDVDLGTAIGAIDLDLDLSPGLDLNLDLAFDVDIRLDRPPVFAVTNLKPLGAARPELTPRPAREPVDTARGAAEQVVAVAAPALPAEASPIAEPGMQAALPASPQTATPVASTVVVATHAERVLRTLETLLANDDRAEADAPGEVFVASHAEKALLTLASTCADSKGRASLAETSPGLSNVEPGAAAACKTSAPASAAPPVRRSPMGAVAMSPGELDRVRGGFDAGNGLQISFGIERAVYINGTLVTTTSLNVAELGRVSGGAAAATSAAAGSGNLTLIQNGAGNTFVTGPMSAATLGTVVQNTLNDQKIQSVTAINATVNSLQMIRAQNFQSSLRGAITDALRR